MYLFPNLAHSGVARNGKGVCSVIAKSGNVPVSKSGTFWSCQEWQRCVLSDCQKWQCNCFQIWHRSCQEWQRCVLKNGNVTVSKSGTFWSCQECKVLKNGNVSVSKSGTFWSCQEWQKCVLSDCQKWQCICFQIWHILELPGTAKVCAQ